MAYATLALQQQFSFNGFDVGGMNPMYSRVETLVLFGMAFSLVVVIAQLVGAFAIYKAAANHERSGAPLHVFPPFAWGLIALVSGPWGLLGTALLFVGLHHSGWFTAPATLGSRRSPGTGMARASHASRVAKLRAELQELKDASLDDLDD